MSGILLQLKLLRGFPGWGTFFFALGAIGGGAMEPIGGGPGAGGARGGGGGQNEGGGGGGGALQVSMTALFRLLTWNDLLGI